MERIHHGTVRLLVIAEEHLVSEVESCRLLSCLVVSAQQIHLIRELDFQSEEVCDNFRTLQSPVHVVAKEQKLFIDFAKLLLAKHFK